ncbi:ATP-binding protein [Candidatus Sumerlaeota bacterium]|nr:ATP-binding protein [Candidatus Sumerlaeota bacterium]
MVKEKDEKPKKACEKCGGAGFIFTEKGIEPCECHANYLLRCRIAAAGIPSRYKNKTIESFKGSDRKRRELRNFAKDYVKTFKPRMEQEEKKGLLYIGVPGCGKTHLAVGILKSIIEKGYAGYFCNVVDFFARLRDSYGGDTSYDEMDMIDKVSKADLLVLDDLGAENPTEWASDRLYTLINRRYESNLPVIVTTNKMDMEQLQQHIGKRIVSRLCEMCHYVDSFPNEDWRMKDFEKEYHAKQKK